MPAASAHRQGQDEAGASFHERVQPQVSTHAAAEAAAERKPETYARRGKRGLMCGFAEGLE